MSDLIDNETKNESKLVNINSISPDLLLRPIPARGPFHLNLMVVLLESIFIIMQYIFGSTLFTAFWRNFLDPALTFVFDDTVLSSIYTIMGSITITCLCLWLFSRNLQVSIRILFERMLTNGKQSFSFDSPILPQLSISSFALTVIGVQIVGIVIMFNLQSFFDLSVLSVSNLFDETGSINILTLVDTVLFAPLREEIIFRGILVSTFYRKLGAQTAKHKFSVVFFSSLFFGSIHLVNLANPDFSTSYVLIQVLFGVLIGVIYGCDFVQHGIIGSLVMHSFNNLCANLVNPSITQDHFFIQLAYLESALVYAYLGYRSYSNIVKSDFALSAALSEGPLPDDSELWSRMVVVDGMYHEELGYTTQHKENEQESEKTKTKTKKVKKLDKLDKTKDDKGKTGKKTKKLTERSSEATSDGVVEESLVEAPEIKVKKRK